ncbi:dynamin B [Cavenderia fasciculata]|uniref:Dynamin B n=1 Tax=Cavenderia fasciculata TaxID=261658 RepID=F4Q562_CACFS|nr:dynamin B [Cavenderia fasciculata]EGG17121.1 dynamin B [Cavenderia fasciculata]|eukprot:XP_004355605.1 dynamin B [Cavenderia fasciculata]
MSIEEMNSNNNNTVIVKELDNILFKFALTDNGAPFNRFLDSNLCLVIEKLNNDDASVKKKVLEVLSNVNKRTMFAPDLEYPLDALIELYHRPTSSLLVKNFAIVYVEKAFNTLAKEKRSTYLTSIITNISQLPSQHQDIFCHIILNIIMVLNLNNLIDSEKDKQYPWRSNEKDYKVVLAFMLDLLLVPTNVGLKNEEGAVVVPPGHNLASLQRVMGKNLDKYDFKALNDRKMATLQFCACGLLPDTDVLVPVIVATCDAFQDVNKRAEDIIKRLPKINWESEPLVTKLYSIFTGDTTSGRLAASNQLREKILIVFCKSVLAANNFPATLQIIFEAVYGTQSTVKVKNAAMSFVQWVFRHAQDKYIEQTGAVILSGLLKLIDSMDGSSSKEETELKAYAYTSLGLLCKRNKKLFNSDLTLVMKLMSKVAKEESIVSSAIQDCLVMLREAFIDIKDAALAENLIRVLLTFIYNGEYLIRLIVLQWAQHCFPFKNIQSRYFSLVMVGDIRPDIREEARRGLEPYKHNGNMLQPCSEADDEEYPNFEHLLEYITAWANKTTEQKYINSIRPDLIREELVAKIIAIASEQQPAKERDDMLNGYITKVNGTKDVVEILALLGIYSPLPIASEETKKKMIKTLMNMVDGASTERSIQEAALVALSWISIGEKMTGDKRQELLDCLFKQVNNKNEELQFSIGEALGILVGHQFLSPLPIYPFSPFSIEEINSSLSKEKQYIGEQESSSQRMVLDNIDQTTDNSSAEEEVTKLFKRIVTSYFSDRQSPITRCSAGIWMLCLLKSFGRLDFIQGLLAEIQNGFCSLLADNNELTQDIASRGITLVYESSTDPAFKEFLVSNLGKTLAGKPTQKAPGSSELLPEGSVTKTGQVSTYKELSNLSTDLGKPDMIYKFMNLSAHHQIWNSRKGASFAIVSLAGKAREEMAPLIPHLVPKIYRYLYDPSPKIAASMQSIMSAIIDQKDIFPKYFVPIIKELLAGMGTSAWRVREASCAAVPDAISHASIEDLEPFIEELFYMNFRTLDDIKETVRKAAETSVRSLGSVTARFVDPGSTVSRAKAQHILGVVIPLLLTKGITNDSAEVKQFSLQLLLKISNSAKDQLSKYVPDMVQALLESLSSLEPAMLNYATMHAESLNLKQEEIENLRVDMSKRSVVSEVLECWYSDTSWCGQVIANLFQSRIIQIEVEPAQVQKLIKTMLPSIMDRSPVTRRQFIQTLCICIKKSNNATIKQTIQHVMDLPQLQQTQNVEENTILEVVGLFFRELYKIASSEIQPFNKDLIPFLYFQKSHPKKEVSDLYKQIWDDNSIGSIRLYTDEIVKIISINLTGSAWALKQQAALCLSNLTEDIRNMMENHLPVVLSLLLQGLKGKTYPGKDSLLGSMSTISSVCAKSIKELGSGGQQVGSSSLPVPSAKEMLLAMLQECKKIDMDYKRKALVNLASMLRSFEDIDIYQQVRETVYQLVFEKEKKENASALDDEMDLDDPKQKALLLLVRTNAFAVIGEAYSSASIDTKKANIEIGNRLMEKLVYHIWNEQISILTSMKLYVHAVFTNTDLSNLIDNKEQWMINILKPLFECIETSKYAVVKQNSLNLIEQLLIDAKQHISNGQLQSIKSILLQNKDRDNTLTLQFEKLLKQFCNNNKDYSTTTTVQSSQYQPTINNKSYYSTSSLSTLLSIKKHESSISKRLYSSNNMKPIVADNNFETVGYSLLPVVNKLQEITSLIGTEIKLPQIVVVGSQSSGKSSVLENLVGRDFLPRGSGLVTRRPLVLQLNRIEPGHAEWGEFGHTGDSKFNFDEIKKEIEIETNRVAGGNKSISSEPIILKIYSPNVIPLTLVDTPGITRIPIGDQPTNIEEKIRDMVVDYISNPNSIILAISAANQDIVTSDALKLAKEVDPTGKRTIGVLTKLDLMDKGVDAMDILIGSVVPLKLGFVGIVNRSQQDINMKKQIGQAIQDESAWFQSHPIYNRIANQSGSLFLGQRCNKILTKHIRESMPGVKNQIRALIKKYEEELERYGDPIPERASEKSRLLIDILNKFALQFRSDLEGVNDEQLTNHVNGGARIRYIFSQAFKNVKERPFEWLTDQQLRVALRNSSGIRPTMFIPQKTFDSLTRIQIDKLKDPALQCADTVLDELLRICTQVDSQVFNRFPLLRERIVEVANNVLRKLLSPTNKMISDMVEAECSYINTSHPVYMSELNRLLHSNTQPNNNYEIEMQKQREKEQQSQSQQGGGGIFGMIFGRGGKESQQPQQQQKQNNKTSQSNILYGMDESYTDDERKQIHLLKRLLHSYYDIAQFNVQENVIKIITHFLVDRSKDVLQRELATVLYDEALVEHLLRENENVVARRKECIYKLEVLKKAKKSLSVTEMNSFMNL